MICTRTVATYVASPTYVNNASTHRGHTGMSMTRAIWSQPNASEQRHICIVTETYPPEVNGVAMTLAHLVEGLRTQGHAVSVVRPRRQPSESSSDRGDPKVTVVPGLPLPGYKGVHVGLPAPGLLQSCWTQHRRSCTSRLRIISDAPKPGKMLPYRDL